MKLSSFLSGVIRAGGGGHDGGFLEIHGLAEHVSLAQSRRLQSAFFHPSRIGQLERDDDAGVEHRRRARDVVQTRPDGNCVAGNLDPLPPSQRKPSDVRAAITVLVFGDEFLLKHPHAGVSAEDVAGLTIPNPNHNAVAINRHAPAKRFTRNWIRMRQGQTGQAAVTHIQRAITVGVGPR